MSFDPVAHFVAEGGILVEKFKSRDTGLTIIKADVEGPIVQGYFTLSTEAHDDDGCPHTLEHLIFLGSELYPYKGILDRVANRNFADGTNAWTATDHTAYTLKTAGSEGFLNALPIYLDHILYPTLTETACHTEVHHVTGDGADAGVVYCEMQAVENTRRSIVSKKMMDLIYPGDSGYKANTGGKMLNLRSLSVDTIRKYHQDYYRVDNLVLIITGKVNNEDLFKALAPVEARISSKPKLPDIPRPWTDPANVLPLTESATEEVPFPSEDLSVGSAAIAWRGPGYTSFNEHSAIVLLWEYLTDSPIAPLMAHMVEIEDPFCSDIGYYLSLYQSTVLRVSFSDVPVDKLTLVKDCFFSKIKEIYESQDIDMDRMQSIITRSKLQRLESLENEPHETICDQVITDFLYGTEPTHLMDLINVTPRLDTFMKEDKSFWLSLLKKYILDPHYVCILARPSDELAKKLLDDETKRVEKQKADLGEEKLKQLAEQLESAMKTNNVPAPDELYTSQPSPSASKLTYVPIETVRNDEVVSSSGKQVLDKLALNSPEKIPFFLQFDHVHSNFVQIKLLLQTSHVPYELRLYLDLYLELIFKNAVTNADGTVISSDDVVSGLTDDTINYDGSLGIGSSGSFHPGAFAQYIVLSIKLEPTKYEKIIDWYRLLLWKCIFAVDKIKVSATKLLNEIPKYKLDGSGMSRAVIQEINYTKLSNYKSSNFIRQAQFLQKVLQKLEEAPESVVADLENLRALITRPDALHVQVVADILSLPAARVPWVHFIPIDAPSSSAAPPPSPQHSSKYQSHVTGKNLLVQVPGLQSSFLLRTSQLPISFSSPPEEIAAVMVASSYFCMIEGLFWRLIRGAGLSYGFGIDAKLEESAVVFNLYRSTNPVKAYEIVAKTIYEHLDKKHEFDLVALVEAQSSCVYEIVAKASTVGEAAQQSLLDYLRKWNRNGFHEVLAHVQKISVDQVRAVLEKYIKPIFEEAQSNIVVATSATKSDEIIAGLKSAGTVLTVIDNLDTFHAL